MVIFFTIVTFFILLSPVFILLYLNAAENEKDKQRTRKLYVGGILPNESIKLSEMKDAQYGFIRRADALYYLDSNLPLNLKVSMVKAGNYHTSITRAGDYGLIWINGEQKSVKIGGVEQKSWLLD